MENKTLDMLQRIASGESFEDCSEEDSHNVKELKEAKLIGALDCCAIPLGCTTPKYWWIDVRLTLRGNEEMERLKKMEYVETEEWIDKLLSFMHKLECEKKEDIVFSFLEDGEHSKLFLKENVSLLYSDLCDIIKSCLHQDYLNQGLLEEFKSVRLRQPGKEKAKMVLAEQKKSHLKAFFDNKYVHSIIMLLIGIVLGAGITGAKNDFSNKKEKSNTVSTEVRNRFDAVENVITNLIENDNTFTNNLEIKGKNDE